MLSIFTSPNLLKKKKTKELHDPTILLVRMPSMPKLPRQTIQVVKNIKHVKSGISLDPK
jgi:hypothetical protein